VAGRGAGTALGHSLPQPGHSKGCVVGAAGTRLGGRRGRSYSALCLVLGTVVLVLGTVVLVLGTVVLGTVVLVLGTVVLAWLLLGRKG